MNLWEENPWFWVWFWGDKCLQPEEYDMEPVLQYLSQVNKRNVYIVAKIRKVAHADSKLHTVLVSCIRPSKLGGMDWTSLALEIKIIVCEEQSKIPNETVTAKITN